MPLSQKEIRERAVEFAHDWADVSRERAEAQSFWNEFFKIFGISRRRVASFEEPVKKLGDKRGSIDLFWKGILLVEHKSKGQSLDKAFEQALDYFPGIKEQELPRYILVSDFASFRLYDLETETKSDFSLAELPDRIHLFGFISGYTKRIYKDQDPVNIQVAEKMGDLHDALLDSGYQGHHLEIFLVRLMYCLFADDTGIFPKDHFHFLIESKTREEGTDTGAFIAHLFQILNTEQEKRERALDEDLQQLPYVNGSLFDEILPIPSFDKKMRQVLLNCCSFDWGKVSPAIFGSLFQSVMDRQKRRNLGAHYTSEKNILKAVRGLFLDDLEREFDAIKNDLGKLRKFHDRISQLRFFDPACGCGNFLVITYREIRRLEIKILKQIQKLTNQQQTELYVTRLSRIDVDSLCGMEIEEFPARIAEVALWLTDHQMNMELSAEFGQTYARLPLKKSANIKHANALGEEWKTFAPHSQSSDATLYILGNPPFVGKHNRSPQQNEDMQTVFKEFSTFGTLDYVCAWYVKAAQFIKGTKIKVAFVSTNSITQGEQVGALWSYLLDEGIKIHFAHRTFKWTNEASGKAQVFCVIIGFAAFDVAGKRLYDYETPVSEPMEITARNINPYLIDYDDIIIPTRNKPLCPVPKTLYGNKPTDNGHLLLTNEERDDLLDKEPNAEEFIKPLISTNEFLYGERKWCLWLKEASPAELRSMPEVMKRVNQVREFRAKSSKASTVKLAEMPYLFAEIRQPDSDYLMIPCHTLEDRRYIPIAFFTKDYILHNSCTSVPNATLYHFGVLTSAMHMAWMRQVCGRLKSDYRYSNNLVYNNFPWPESATDAQKEKVESAAQNVIDARAQFPDSTLADLYDPNAMPQLLLKAHRELDAAVDRCYRSAAFKTELERLEFLFALYRKYTEPLVQSAEKASRKAKRSKKS